MSRGIRVLIVLIGAVFLFVTVFAYKDRDKFRARLDNSDAESALLAERYDSLAQRLEVACDASDPTVEQTEICATPEPAGDIIEEAPGGVDENVVPVPGPPGPPVGWPAGRRK